MLLSIWNLIDFWELDTWSTIFEILQYGTAFWILYLCTIHSNNMIKKSEFSWTADTKTVKFVWFIVAAILSIAFTYCGKRVDERMARMETNNINARNKVVSDSIATAYTDTLRKNTRDIVDILASYNLALRVSNDGFKSEIVEMDSTIKNKIETSKKEAQPTLNIPELPTITNNNGRFMFNYEIESTNADSHIDEYSYVAINSHTLEIQNIYGYTLNSSDIIKPSIIPRTVSLFMENIEIKSDTLFLGIEYKYHSKGGIEQQPMRKIYRIIPKTLSVTLFDTYQYGILKKVLNDRSVWLDKKK